MRIPSHGIPSNLRRARQIELDSRHNKPYDKALQLKYGIIHEVSDNKQVRIRLLTEEGNLGDIIGGETKKIFMPLLNQEVDINLRWGELRKGLVVRVWWRGSSIEVGGPIAEIIADEMGTEFLKRKPVEENGPGMYKIMAPGSILA
jgi:hypothetical protein